MRERDHIGTYLQATKYGTAEIKMKSFEIRPQESGQALALLPRKIGFEHLGRRFSVSILPLS